LDSNHPSLLNERNKQPGTGNEKSWDKYIVFGLFIGFLLIILLITRTGGEEKKMIKELAGYAEYKKKFRFQLIPFVW
jgi:protein-S-isoprenylcysteine O-methyltransferase Ste14